MKDDQELIEQTLQGDMQAFRWLIAKHQHLVTHVAGRIVRNDDELEEVCQDIFLKIYQKLDTFRGDSKFTTWLVSVAYRMSLNHINKKRHQNVDIDEIRDLSSGDLPSAAIEAADSTNLLERALEHLPEHFRMTITLFHLEEMTIQEVSKIMEVPEGTIKSNLYRGRKMLKELLTDYRKSQLI